MKHVKWWKNWRAAHKRRDYAYSLMGSTLPKSHLKRPSRHYMMSSAARFAKDGEIRNAVEMMKLAYYPEQLKFTFQLGKKQ
jgi:hypothetical protein